jgi:hypothetical protein
MTGARRVSNSKVAALTIAIGVTSLLSACSVGVDKDAKYYASEACKKGDGIEAMVMWSKARQLDEKWTRAADAHADSQLYKGELNYLSKFLDKENPQYRDVEMNWSRASFVLISECAALKIEQ